MSTIARMIKQVVAKECALEVEEGCFRYSIARNENEFSCLTLLEGVGTITNEYGEIVNYRHLRYADAMRADFIDLKSYLLFCKESRKKIMRLLEADMQKYASVMILPRSRKPSEVEEKKKVVV